MVPPGNDSYGPDRYGESFADVYDDWYDDVSNAEATAQFVSGFGPHQRVLELGVGTGRLSLALDAAGHTVVGVDASAAMLKRFRGAAKSWALGADMATLPVRDGVFDTVLVATNTLFNLHTEAGQESCLRESRRALRLGGRLIIEALIPADGDPALDRMVTTRSVDIDTAVLTATIRDVETQQITGQHIEFSNSGVRMRPWKIRYLTLDQLDAMATTAGFRLGQRTNDWDNSPVTDSSGNAISVYVAV